MPTIRPYQAADEKAVRRLCFETALYGDSMAPVWNDPELVTEALIGYYLRWEPEHILVAEAGGIPVGYLTACLDHERFQHRYRRHVTPHLLRLMLRHGRWHDAQLWRQLPRFATHGRQRRALLALALPAYPAHLHINLAAAFRQAGLGGLLLRTFQDMVARAGVVGAHAVTTSPAGRAFFERHGFRTLASRPTPSLRDGTPVMLHLLAWPASPAVRPAA
ncbi:MAG: hypothetical protein K8T26_15495 [Lentisphaerae bacterium]|nr:hypothetical protein [Lentisphaerota bacterium]